MNGAQFVFRTLPGIAEVQALLDKIYEHPNPEWAPEQDQLKPLVDRISRNLFGITAAETQYVDDPADENGEWRVRFDRWEQNFLFAECSFSPDANSEDDDRQEMQIWELLGWDVTDGNGQIHDCLPEFQRQMICATKGLRGRLPDQPQDEQELALAAEQWGKSLLASQSIRRGGRR